MTNEQRDDTDRQVIEQVKSDPEQSARAYRDVWSWWQKAVSERDDARAEIERLRFAIGVVSEFRAAE